MSIIIHSVECLLEMNAGGCVLSCPHYIKVKKAKDVLIDVIGERVRKLRASS